MKSQQKSESKENLNSEYGCSFCKNLIKHRDENSKLVDLECDFYGCFLSSVDPFGCKFFIPLDFLIHGTDFINHTKGSKQKNEKSTKSG